MGSSEWGCSEWGCSEWGCSEWGVVSGGAVSGGAVSGGAVRCAYTLCWGECTCMYIHHSWIHTPKRHRRTYVS